MSNQHKISEKPYKDSSMYHEMTKVLDLEKKYMKILWDLFIKESFISDLKDIEDEIKKHYSELDKVWKLKNKLKIPAERLVRYYIYRELSSIITHIYPSPVSSDIAFITNDAIINLDVKTLDICGNKTDIGNLQFENNQSSFDNINLDIVHNIPNSGIKVDCQLPVEYQYKDEVIKPLLTYFLIIVYEDNKQSFQLSRDECYQTIQLKCLPNGILSELFENDIVANFKTYCYFDKKDNIQLEPIFLTNNKNLVNNMIEKYVQNNKNCDLISGRTKNGVFFKDIIHPYNNMKGVSFFPVSRKNNTEYYLEAVKKGDTSRVKNDTLKDRYDSNDGHWLGIEKYCIK